MTVLKGTRPVVAYGRIFEEVCFGYFLAVGEGASCPGPHQTRSIVETKYVARNTMASTRAIVKVFN
jgi:hypothetical protein